MRKPNKKAAFLIAIFAITILAITFHYHSFNFQLSDCPICKAKSTLGSSVFSGPVFDFSLASHCEQSLNYIFIQIKVISLALTSRAPPQIF